MGKISTRKNKDDERTEYQDRRIPQQCLGIGNSQALALLPSGGNETTASADLAVPSRWLDTT
jgi:hypothetical protein